MTALMSSALLPTLPLPSVFRPALDPRKIHPPREDLRAAFLPWDFRFFAHPALGTPITQGESVLAWISQPATGWLLAQIDAGLSPTWQRSAIAGRPAVHFTSGRYLEMPEAPESSAGFTIYVRFQLDQAVSAATDRYGLVGIANSSDSRFALLTGDPIGDGRLALVLRYDDVTQAVSGGPDLEANRPYVATVVWSPDRLELYLDRARIAWAASDHKPSVVTASSSLRLGQTFLADWGTPLEGHISHFIVHARPHAVVERRRVWESLGI